MRRRRAPALLSIGIGAALAVAVTSGGGAQAAAPAITIVADHLNNPRQIAVRDDAVYVVEAGKGGNTCFPDGSCVGLSGSVTRVRNGDAERIQTGLLSVNAGEGEVVGVDGLAFRGGDLYGVATGACDLSGAPAVFVAQAGKVLRMDGGNKVTAVADPSALECTKDPDGQGPDTDPYGLAARGKAFWVADAAGNDVVRIHDGQAAVATVLSKNSQPVPTSLAFGPDGALYIGSLNFEAGPGGAKVYRLAPGASKATVYASGFTAITAIAFGKSGSLFVSEFTKGFDKNGPLPNGDVVVVPWGGGQAGRKVLGSGLLHFPTGVGITSDGIYVSNWGIASGQDGAFGPGNHGQLVRLPLPG